MSIVYRAENPRLGTTVALKVLAPELAEDESFRERFVTESRLAAALNHPNIITIYDAGEADGSLYIAMRYVSADLKQVFEAEGALPPGRLIPLLGQAADALDAAHAKDLIHRDVKPANILLDALAHRLFGEPFDRDGARAARGTPDEALLETLLAEPYFLRPPPKSTGRELFGAFLATAASAAPRAEAAAARSAPGPPPPRD